MTDDFPDWQKAVMAFKGGASEMTDDYPDWVMGVAVEAGSQVGGGQLIDVKTASQYYDAKTASLSFGGMGGAYYWWSRACRGINGFTEVIDYLTLDISSLTSGMTTPIITVHFQMEVSDLEFANDYGDLLPAICKNDNTVIVDERVLFERDPLWIPRAYHLMADITTEKSNKIKIRFKERVSMHGMGSICATLRMFPFIQLFDAES